MIERGFCQILRFFIPQVITASRVLLSGAALSSAVFRRTQLTAILITLGAVTDGLDGSLARKLRATTEFGALFDYFADYLCYIVVPVVLSTLLIEQAADPLALFLLGLPLLAGIIRYARNAIWLRRENFEELGFPGLGTVFYAFFIVTLVFLDLENTIGAVMLRRSLFVIVPWLSCMMVLPLRYPKLMKYKLVLVPILLALCLMTFAFTKFLATCTLVLGFIYAVAAPFFISHHLQRGSLGTAADSSPNTLGR